MVVKGSPTSTACSGAVGGAPAGIRELRGLPRRWVALELARVDASVATVVGMQNRLVMGAIGVGGSRRGSASRWLPRFASGELLGAHSANRSPAPDTAQGLRTTATRDGDEWVINGAKRWIGNGTLADVTVVWAKDTEDGQVEGFLVPTDNPGYRATRIEDKIALRIVQNAQIELKDVRIPAD